ncbi:MAG: acyl--CoA ligase, partial [Myxococcales bacterium]|nr:acyl--CoA ligase [Myxococcales bacterium]
ALFMTNSTAYLEVLYGIWWAGAAAVTINAWLHENEAAWIIADSASALVFADDTSAPPLCPLLPEGIPVLSTHSAEYNALCTAPPLARPLPLDPGDMIWLFYTSGTTGKPKGVMLTCANLAAMTFSYFVDVDEVSEQDAILYAAPMSHGAGLYNFMHILRGARHVVPESGGFDAGEILGLAPEIGPVSMFAAPTMVRRLVDTAKARGSAGEGLRTIV